MLCVDTTKRRNSFEKVFCTAKDFFSLAAAASAEVNKPRELLFRTNNWQPAGGYAAGPIWRR